MCDPAALEAVVLLLGHVALVAQQHALHHGGLLAVKHVDSRGDCIAQAFKTGVYGKVRAQYRRRRRAVDAKVHVLLAQKQVKVKSAGIALRLRLVHGAFEAHRPATGGQCLRRARQADVGLRPRCLPRAVPQDPNVRHAVGRAVLLRVVLDALLNARLDRRRSGRRDGNAHKRLRTACKSRDRQQRKDSDPRRSPAKAHEQQAQQRDQAGGRQIRRAKRQKAARARAAHIAQRRIKQRIARPLRLRLPVILLQRRRLLQRVCLA